MFGIQQQQRQGLRMRMRRKRWLLFLSCDDRWWVVSVPFSTIDDDSSGASSLSNTTRRPPKEKRREDDTFKTITSTITPPMPWNLARDKLQYCKSLELELNLTSAIIQKHVVGDGRVTGH